MLVARIQSVFVRPVKLHVNGRDSNCAVAMLKYRIDVDSRNDVRVNR